MPEIRRQGGMLIGYDGRFSKRWVRPRLRQVASRLRCLVIHGHQWGKWTIDDYDGPGEELEEGGFMPWLSRESHSDEYGERHCERLCGAREQRWPEREAPQFWVDQADAYERAALTESMMGNPWL